MTNKSPFYLLSEEETAKLLICKTQELIALAKQAALHGGLMSNLERYRDFADALEATLGDASLSTIRDDSEEQQALEADLRVQSYERLLGRA